MIQVLEKGTQIPIKDVSVFFLPEKIKKETNAKGVLNIDDSIKEKEIQLIISLAGYKRFDQWFNLENEFKKNKILSIYLEKEDYGSFETIIKADKIKKDNVQKSLSKEEVRNMPGANGDPIKALQNLPGVNRTQGFSSAVVIQGSAPKDTSYDYEGHAIPIVFHFGGLSSVVMPEALEQVDYYSAGYQSPYSRALGGIISLQSRLPEVEEREKKGLFYLDNLSMGGLFESKIDDNSSFLISGRYSYIGTFLKAALKDEKSLNLTVAPEYQDLTAIYHRKLNENENLKVSFLASKDRMAFVLNEPLEDDPSIRGSFSNLTQFYRIIPSWTKKINSSSQAKLSLGYGQDQLGYEIGDQYFKLLSRDFSVRGEFQKEIDQQNLYKIGFDNIYSTAVVDLKVPQTRESGGVNNPISSGEDREGHIKARSSVLGLFSTYTFNLNSEWQFTPGLRFDRFSSTNENYLLPRYSMQFTPNEKIKYHINSGMYVQAPEPQEYSEDYGNSEISSPQAIHLSAAVDYDLSQENNILNKSNLILGVFDRWYRNLVVQSSNTVERNGETVYEVYNNDGRGRSYGFETQYKFSIEDYSGFVSYTLSKSRRWTKDISAYDFEYDQTHNLNFVVAKKLKNEWKISSRLRYVTGNPYTPIVGGVFDADNDVYFPQRGSIYSKRYNDFYQLDLRVDKKIINNESVWTIYLDIQNILNTKNTESLQYSYDYSTSEKISGLPLLPSIGVRGEF